MTTMTPTRLASALALLIALPVNAQRGESARKPDPQAAQSLPAGDFAVHCGVLHIGDGRTMKGVYLIVRDGRVAEYSASRPEDLPVHDASGKSVMPGIVAADSELVESRDDPYNVTPDFMAIDGFDFLAPRTEALAGGVTSAYLSPGRARLVSGQGAVVKLRGDDVLHRVMAESACLRLNMGVEATQAPRVFEPTPHPTADDPLLPARQQAPTARISILPELRELFRTATAPEENGSGGTSPASALPIEASLLAEERYDVGPLARVVAGSLPLRIAARQAADIRRAVQFAAELGVSLVLEDPQEIAPVAASAAEQGAAAVFRIPVNPGASNPGGEDRRREERLPVNRPDNAAQAARAGMRIALVPHAETSLRDYLMTAAIAIRHGLDPDRAMRAITLDAAHILGVADRVGSLEPGKDADILVLSGEPFAVGTMVEATWVDGQPAFEREVDDSMLAVRCGLVLTGEGESIEGGVLVAEGRRIKAVGAALPAPFGATVIDVPGGVMVPGFIDAFSHIGLAGEGTGVPNGAANQNVAEAVDHADPAFREALESGVTTALVSGTDSGTVSGRVSAIKLGAGDREGMVLKSTAALRFQHDEIGPDAIKPLRDAIDRGKRYVEAWAKYEKALADWKAGKGQEPKEQTTAPAPATQADPISGTWEINLDIQGRFQITILLDLTLQGQNVTGQVRASFGGREAPPQEISSGTFTGGKLTLEFSGMGGEATLEATVEGDSMTGSISMGPMGSQDFTAQRISKEGGAAPVTTATDESGEPKKPNVDENLEPFRAMFKKQIPAVVKTDRSPAIRDVLALFAEHDLPLVLHGAEDAVETPDLLGQKRPGVLLEPNVVERDGGSWSNAASELAEADVPVALVTGDTEGTRHLPIHAAYAVRYGLSPEDALAALTINPARLLALDDRVGSLEKGKDADFVVFSGPPFELTSRVLLVVVNGQVVVDNREAVR